MLFAVASGNVWTCCVSIWEYPGTLGACGLAFIIDKLHKKLELLGTRNARAKDLLIWLLQPEPQYTPL